MKRLLVLVALLVGACGGDNAPEHQIPRVVKAGETAACKADTATLKSGEQAAFAATNAYIDQATPLHKAMATGSSYVITVVDARCGTVGHRVGATPTDY